MTAANLDKSESLRGLPLTCEKENYRVPHPSKKLSDGKSPSYTYCNDWVIRWRGGAVLGQGRTLEDAISDAEENVKSPFWSAEVRRHRFVVIPGGKVE